ncbi:MAG: acyl-CoA thioesterase/BAAT N-terminal domain-containing protein [Candidatus Aminicenantes bacterium]|nr:acyl-CoA thioesterase/BAAT N-terminal domain-containing protein [Candidatus Aminicenantes bacterium]
MFHQRKGVLLCLFFSSVIIASGPLTSCVEPQDLTISINPAQALFGTPFSMTIAGLKPGEHAVLKARSIDGMGTFWDSTATFEADRNGKIDLSSQAPIAGDYAEPDVMGMLWAMQPSNRRDKARPYVAYEHGITVEFTLNDAKGRTAAAILGRYYQMPDTGLVRVPLDANGCKGFLYYPEKGGPFPGLILLGGSGGGMSDIKARTLASNGFATLALAYFRYPGLPGYLIEIPLEYFRRAIEWMKTCQAVQKGKLGLVGYSKGGECSLLLASLYDEFSAVAAMVPSAYVWKGVTPLAKSSWTMAGEPLPFISTKETEEEVQQFIRRELTSIRKWYAGGLAAADPELVNKARIPVENIKAPIFLASDRADQTWPSVEFCETIVQNLKARHFPYEYKHICGENAGHHACWPDYIPGTDRGVNAGNPKDKVKWSLIVWKEMLSFLHKYLDAPSKH